MATAFRCESGRVRTELGEHERGLLVALIMQLIELVKPDQAADALGLGPADASISDDPVLARLLPNAYADDAEAAAEFRRLTEHSLRSRKVEALHAMRSTLGHDELVLGADESRAWLAGLNDLRLALGTRMGLGEDNAEEPAEEWSAIYDWLTWMQDCLVDAIGDCADTLAP